MSSDLAPLAPETYVRAVCTPALRQVVERHRPEQPGVGQIGGTLLFNGVAYLHRYSRLAVNPPDGLQLSEDFTMEQLDDYRQRVSVARDDGWSAQPTDSRAGECAPGRCAYGVGHACRRVFPQNFREGEQ